MPETFQYNKRKPCYFCGSRNQIGKEHAPPDMLFKDGPPCGRLTVPSCPDHNGKKGDRDFAVLCALIRSVEQSIQSGDRTSDPETVLSAIARIRRNYDRAKRSVSMKKLLTDPPVPRYDIDFPTIHDDAYMKGWMICLTAALVWTATGTHETDSDWKRAMTWSPCHYEGVGVVSSDTFLEHFKGKLKNLEALRDGGTWYRGWQPTPPYPDSLYKFEVLLDKSIHIRHTFFGNMDFFTAVQTSEDTKNKITRLLGPAVDKDDWWPPLAR